MKIFRYGEVGSTNDVAFEKLSGGELPIFAISAESQTKGRGHHGHTWVSKKGNLFLSFALDVASIPVADVGIFPQCFVLAFARSLDVPIQMKWPNDIFYDNRKIGGVLLETKFEKTRVRYAVLGVGINVSSAPDLGNTSSARYFAGILSTNSRIFSVNEVEQLLIDALERTTVLSRRVELVSFLQENWSTYDIFYNTEISVKSNGQQFRGIDVGVSEVGALKLRDKNNTLYCFNSAKSEIIIDCW